MEKITNGFKHINHDRVAQRSYNEFIGYAKGIIADNKIDTEEAKQIALWLDANAIYLYDYINTDLLLNTIKHTIEDDIITDEESKELIKFIKYILYTDEFSNEIDYVLGFMRGISANNIITEKEAKALFNAIKKCEDKTTFPISKVYEYFKNNKDFSDNTELLSILKNIYGGNLITNAKASLSCLPVDNPQPDIEFKDKVSTLTGEFAFGTRAQCVKEIEKHGGKFSKNVTQNIHYLTIGSIGSDDWQHSSFGRKIEKALQLKKQGKNIIIISEDHWAKYI